MELRSSEKASVFYHNIFDYPLNQEELKRWQAGPKVKIKNQKVKIKIKNNYIFLNGRKNVIEKRLQNEKYSKEKLKIAKKAANLISKIPTVKFVGITGALAMMNAGKNSDIDLMIITKQNTLWTTRLFVYCILHATFYMLRKPRVKNERDALCLNMWLDEEDVLWDKKDRNIYTAHEIAQIVPLINKNKTYERFLYLNRWILDYWPNSVQILNSNTETLNKFQFLKFNSLNIVSDLVFRISNFFAYRLQYFYMRPKITREVVTSTRAIFHPNDWGKIVLTRLGG